MTLTKKEMKIFRYVTRSRGHLGGVFPIGSEPDLPSDHPLRKNTGPPEYTKWEPKGTKKKLLPSEPMYEKK